jgi:hypothetical protein
MGLILVWGFLRIFNFFGEKKEFGFGLELGGFSPFSFGFKKKKLKKWIWFWGVSL